MIFKWPKEWDNLKKDRCKSSSVNVIDFIKKKCTPYEGDESFFAEAAKQLWNQIMEQTHQEREAGSIPDMDTMLKCGLL